MKITALDGEILNPGDVSWEPISRLGEFKVYPETARGKIAERVKDADVVLVNKTPIREESLPALTKCALVGVLATGANNIDLADLARAGISVCNTPAYGVEEVAQHALALLLELARGVGELSAGVKAGEWQKRNEWCYWHKAPLSLRGLNLGIIGFGGIGQAFGRMANALGMNVFAPARKRAVNVDYPVKEVSLEEIWKLADVISLHCPLTPETAKIINAQTIAVMRPGALIINTARGGLLDEAAVAQALSDGKLGGLAADTLAVEPPVADNSLLSAPNVIITPHMAWAPASARQNIIDITAANIEAFARGVPQNIINEPINSRKFDA